ncbi:Gfo/Idh/MocA family protein [Arthrobacter burdickii]|uniref:Gfo/Idh/MocA family oxidoreductase n=1 Tax=Arthrobacter burdickii TaxID=3035920 RepID=A0ABT8K4L4_9MICC|nr:Gfo/Idh/MocA family oxidoreductase [Arthrobacter burdickii]MDN4612380.1 Gfo/Idh/MocA family oxidoreductase [Arthrobacter burdickii]
MRRPFRTAILGFGISGKVFHAPLVAANGDFTLDVIVTADPQRAQDARATYPSARIVGTPAELFALIDAGEVELDVVVLGTPPGTHAEQARQAFARGIHVVADKPFVPTSSEGTLLLQEAAEAGVLLTVFQNRRWDADFLTLGKLLASGELGEVHTFESRFEWWRPGGFGNWRDTTTVAEGGGILHDLGAHLIDQAIRLFGPVQEAYGELDRRTADAVGDQDSFVSLRHASGVRSRLWMSGFAALPGARFSVSGSSGAYTKWGLDTQEPALAAGADPAAEEYGVEPEEAWGTVSDGTSEWLIRPERGDYPAFYALLARALRGEGPLPVDPQDSIDVLRIIEDLHNRSGHPAPAPSPAPITKETIHEHG